MCLNEKKTSNQELDPLSISPKGRLSHTLASDLVMWSRPNISRRALCSALEKGDSSARDSLTITAYVTFCFASSEFGTGLRKPPSPETLPGRWLEIG
ncbi:unnamed protein product, partial [Iphiclides podalirius]